MKLSHFVHCMILVVSMLCAGCGDSETVKQSEPAKSEGLRSYGELAKERSDNRDPHGGVPLEFDPEYRVLAAGLTPSAAGEAPASVPLLSEQADRASPVPSRFRLSMARCEEAFVAIQAVAPGQSELPKAVWRVLFDLDIAIDQSVFWEMNQRSSDVDFLQARRRLVPARRAWILCKDAEAQICTNGMGGFFGNRGSEAAAAARSFAHFGMNPRAEAIDRAIAGMPRTASGAVDWEVYPLPEATSQTIERDFEAFKNDGMLERAVYALNHPELFFTHAADAFVPEPLPGAKSAK